MRLNISILYLKTISYYRSGVNDGLRVALGKIDKPKIAFVSKGKSRN